MEKTTEKISINQIPEKEDINWAEYLDYTRFFKPAEINNISLEFFKEDFENFK
ncbi:MAG: hypothetical protein ACW986_11435 [Promethearchaeota archaeon]|jgi:hypothetical protein